MIVAKDIYENEVIAGFMALLHREHGIRHGRAPFEPFGLQLLQQTPLDQTLGDVVIAQARLVRLIEFKRRRNKSRKERVKLHTLKTALTGAHLEPLFALSREVHWYVESDYSRKQATVVVPYLDLENPTGNRTLEIFVEEIGEAMAGPGMSDAELGSLRNYMKALALCAGDKETEAESGGLIIATGTGGETRLYPIKDVRELVMSPQQVFHEHKLRMEQTLAAELAQQRIAQERVQKEWPQQIQRPGLSLGL